MENKEFKPIIFGVDFDGTSVSHEFPEVGVEIGATEVLKQLVANGHKLILWTMRSDIVNPTGEDNELHLKSGQYLTDAVNWFKERNIPLYGIQTNPTQHTWTTSPKAYCITFLDDAGLGMPLVSFPQISKRKFVNWVEASRLLRNDEAITESQFVVLCSGIKKMFNDVHGVYIEPNW